MECVDVFQRSLFLSTTIWKLHNDEEIGIVEITDKGNRSLLEVLGVDENGDIRLRNNQSGCQIKERVKYASPGESRGLLFMIRAVVANG